MSDGKLTRERTTTYIDTTVEIDISDLADNGWHHEDDCPRALPNARASTPAVADALASLHRQAHPSQLADPLMCREEPCRSLSYGELRPADVWS